MTMRKRVSGMILTVGASGSIAHRLTPSVPRPASPLRAVTGGRNGYGAKLANIFSAQFTIEVADGTRGRKYLQVFSNNMQSKTEPAIEPYKGSDYTCITFKPELARFGMTSLDADTVALLSRRVYDMAGVLGRNVAVTLNGSRLPISSFADYVAMHKLSDKGEEAPRIAERINDRWEVAFTVSDGIFSHVSFVNSICTHRGGQHVSYIMDQIANAVAEHVNKKNKGVDVKPAHVRSYMTLFVNCQIENPAFDSQTKDTLTTRPKDFGSTAELSDKFIKQGKVTRRTTSLSLSTVPHNAHCPCSLFGSLQC